jgi:1,4-dihydroxy-2-naphthoate octaprenyltransferase
VASINVGKHIDKRLEDKAKSVTTLPVLIGETAARVINVTVIILAYASILYLVFLSRFFTPAMLLVFLDSKDAWKAVKRLPKP